MTAAEITPTTVAKMDNPSTTISGTARRFKRLYLEATKVTQNDWIVLSDHISATEITQVVGWTAVVEATGNAYEIDVLTFDSDLDKVVLTAAAVGPVHIVIDYFE